MPASSIAHSRLLISPHRLFARHAKELQNQMHRSCSSSIPHPSAKVFDQHEIEVELVPLRVETPTLVGRDCDAGYLKRRSRPFERCYLCRLTGGEIKELKRVRSLMWLRCQEVDTSCHHSPIPRINVRLEDSRLLAAGGWHFPQVPQSRFFTRPQVVNAETVGGFRRVTSTSPRQLNGCAARAWHLPHFVSSGAVGGEVNPVSISRPARSSLCRRFGHQAARAATVGADRVDVCVAARKRAEGDEAT